MFVIFEKLVMVIPEPSLPVGCKSRLCCVQCDLLIRAGVIFVNHLDVLGVFLQHLLEYRLEPGTVRSLVVLENSHSHHRIFRPPERKSGHIELMHELELNKLEVLARTAAQHQGVVSSGVG